VANRRHPPNRLLSWERLQRGWSYEEVADRIRAEMASAKETDTGLNSNTVRRWETGDRWPDPRYRKHLVTIFGKPASRLGLLTPDEQRLCPDVDLFVEFRRLWDVMMDAMGDGISRADVLKGLLGLGMLPGLSPLLGFDPDSREGARPETRVDPGLYATIAGCHRQLYWTTPARPLFESAYAHAHLGTALMRGASIGVVPTLGSALAESALLAARLAFFDLGRTAVAERCFDVALEATRQCGDHGLASVVIGHMAFIPAFGNDADAARCLLHAARQHTWHGGHPLVRSWLHCVASEAEARAGDCNASRHHIDLALAAADTTEPAPEWLDFYDSGRLTSFAGYAMLINGDYADAQRSLTEALDQLGPTGAKQRSVVLADLASCHVDDAERQAHYLNQALDAVETEWYQTGLNRIREVRGQLGDSALGAEVDERIDALVRR
jgi:transcriptional regulator with XRE-family HTH domain